MAGKMYDITSFWFQNLNLIAHSE